MAKKKTDKLDNDFDFGDDDFNFDDMDASMSMDSKPKKDRGVVSDVFSGTISGIKSKFTDPEFIGEGVRKSMPKSYDYFTEGVNSAAKNFAGTYNDAVKELKPQVASIASNLNKIIPEHLKGVKKLSDKFDKFMNGEGSRATSTENIEGQLVSNTLSAVFGNQDKKADEERAADKADQKVKDIIDDKRFRSSNAILGRIADATSRSTSLQESVGIGYMKKSLELQVRQLFTLQNLTDKSVKFQEIAARQYESIVKNTSMPEFVKLKESERFKQLAKDKFYGGIQGNLLQMTGLGKMSERMRKDAGDYVSGVKNGLMATNDGLEMIKDKIQEIEELKDSGLNISKAEMLGQLLGGGISVKARSLVTDAIKKALSKDAKVDKAGNRLSTMALNAGGYAKRYKNKDSFQDKLYSEGITGKLYSALNYILGTAGDEGGDFKLKNATSIASINEPGKITNKFIRSVEEVIPTWLAHIHRELIITRTGEVKTELGRFDFTKGVLISKSEATRKVTDRLNKDADNLMHRSNVDKTYSNFVGDAEVDPSIEKELKSFIVKLSREKNTVYDSEGISNTKHFKNLSPEAKKQVSKLLEKYETNDDSLEKSRKELELTSDMSDTRKSTTDIRASIEEMMKTYGVDVLLDEGIVEYDASGALQINEDKYYQILETGRLATSDKNKKKNIKPFGGLKSRFAVSDINAKEDISKPKGSFLDKVRDTGVFSWMYKDGKGDGDPHVGPMAQDVKKNMGEEAAPGGKKIDLVNLNGINMAATQELADRVDNGLNINAEGISYAKSTSDSLTEILAILKDKKFFTLGLPEGFDIGKLDIKGKASKALAAGKEAVGTAAGMAKGAAKGAFGGAKGAVKGAAKGAAKGAFGMAKGAAKGAFGGAKGTAKWLNDVIFSPGLNYLNKDETKEKITKTLGDVADSALGLGSFLVKQMNKTVTERIPAVIKTVKDKAKKFFDFLYDGIIETPDLYIKGKKEAVILINRLKAGDYYDSVTGKVLTTLKDIEQCKGDILDRGGKIVATAAEASQGFVDRMGNVVKRKAVNALQLGIAVGTKVIGAGLKAAKNVGSRVGKMLGLNDGKFDNFKDAISDAFKDMNLMGGSGVSNEAIIDIRDLLFKLHPKEALEIEKAKKNAKGDEVKRHKGIIQSVKNLFKQEQKEEKAVHAAEVNSENAVKAEEGSASVAGNSGNGPGVPGGQFGKLTAKAKDYFNTKDEDGSTKGDKLKAGATNLKDKVLGSKMGTAAKGRFSKAGKFLSKIPGSGKVATLAKGAGGLLGKGLGVAGGMFSSFMGGGDAAETGTEDTSDNTKAEAGRSFKAANKGLSVNKTGPIAFNDKDGNGRRDGAFEDRLAEANKEKEERLKKKSLEKGEMKYRNKGNVIDKLMGLFAGSFGKIAGAATSLIGKFLGKGGLLAKSLGWLKGGKLFTKLLGLGKILGIGGSIAAGAGAAGSVAESVGDAADLASTGSKATKATTVASKASKVSKFGRLASLAKNALGIGSAVSTAASVAGSVGTAAAGTAAAGTAAAGTAAAGTAAAGTAAAATGTAAAAGGAAASGGLMASFGAALLSPLAIGVAVVGVVVGGYYLYKYLTRNSVDDYEEARMYQYGFGHTEDSKSHFGKLLALEAYLQDGRTGYNKDKTYIISKKIDPKELYEFFKIDPKDSVKLTEFNDWFNNRFVPVYLYHTKTLYDINNKAKLDGISSLKLDEKLKYLESAAFESAPYSVTSSPVKDVAILNSDPSLAKKKIDEIRAKVITKDKKSTNIDLRNKKTNIDFVDKKEADKELAKNNAKAEREVISAIKPASPLASTSKAAPIANALGAGEDGPQDKLGEGKAITAAKAATPLSSTSKAAPIANALGAGEDGPQDKLGEGKAVTDAGSSITYAPSSIPAASGNLKDGSGGTAFMKFSSKSVSIDSMNPEMKKRLLGMIQEYGELTGKNITVNSGSRTPAQQAALYRQNPAKAAKPGRSLHEFGLAVDINSVDANKLDEMGLMRKYGFTRPVGGETWHVEPVGIQGRIGDVKADAGLASSLVAAGEGFGGGGIGSIKGSKLGSRDPNGSKGVFAASNKNVTNKQETDTGTSMPPKAVVADSSSVPSGGSSSSSSSGTETTSIMKTGLAGAPSGYSGTTTSGAPTAPADNIANSIAEPEAKPSDSAGAVASTGPSSSSKGTGVEGAIEEGSKKTGMDPSMMKAFAAVESSMNPNAAARTSSAKGLYQFLDATWNEQVKKNGRKYGLQPDANRFDPYTSTVIAGEYLKTNLKGVSSIKKDTNIVDAYLTHFLGPGGARTFLSADPSALAADVMPSAAKANTNIFYNGGKPRTISEVYNYLKDKIAAKAKSFGITLGNVTGMGSKPSGNTNTGEMGIGGGNTGGSQASAAPSGKPSTSTPSIANPSTVSKVDPNSSKGPGFTRIDPVADNSSVNTSVSPSRDASSPESGMSVLVDVNKQQLQVFSAMFEYLKAELPKLGVKQEVQEPSTRVQDVAKQQAANQTSAGTVDNTKPSRNEIPPPSVSMGRRPFA